MFVLYDQNKRPFVVDSTRAANLLESGAATAPDIKYAFISPDGAVIGVQGRENVIAKLREGYRMETPDEERKRYYKENLTGGGWDAASAAMGALRGATFGLSDLAARALPGIDKEMIEGLKEANPYASTAGELAGGIGSMFIPGGQIKGAATIGKAGKTLLSTPFKAAKAAAALTTKVAEVGGSLGTKAATAIGFSEKAAKNLGTVAKGASLTVASGLESGAYGVTTAMTMADYEDRDATAESIMANAKTDFLWGGALGGIFGIGAPALSRALKSSILPGTKKAIEGAGKIMSDYSEKAAPNFLRAAGISDTAIKRMDEGFRTTGAKTLTDGDFFPAAQADGTIRLEPIVGLEALEGAEKVALSSPEVIERYHVAKKYWGTAIESLKEQADEAFTDVMSKKQGHIEGFTSPIGPEDFVSWRKVITRIEELEGKTSMSGEARTTLSRMKAKYLNEAGEFLDAPLPYSVVDKERAALQSAWKEITARQVGDKKVYEDTAASAKRDVERILQDEIKTSIESLTTKIGQPEIATQLKAANEKYSRLARLGRLIPKAGALADIKASKALGSLAQYGIRGTVWRMTSGRSGLDALKFGALATAVHGATFFTPGLKSGMDVLAEPASRALLQQKATRAAAIATIHKKVVDKVDRATASVVDNAAKWVPKIVGAGAGPLDSAYHELFKVSKESDFQRSVKRYGERLREIPLEDLANNISANLEGVEEVSPEVAEGAARRAAGTYKALSDASFKPQPGTSIQPLLDDAANIPTKEQAWTFAQILLGSSDPLMVIDSISNGTATPLMVSTMRQHYPKMYEQFVSKLGVRLASMPKRASGKLINYLSITLGIPLSESMTPEAIQRAQAAYQPLPQEQQQNSGQMKPFDVQETFATPGQRPPLRPRF